jgi:hypothetical protein
VQIYTNATTMWLANLSAEFIYSSKEQIKQDPQAFWPDGEGEDISTNWVSYPGNSAIYFEGDEEEVYADTEVLPQINVLVTKSGTEFRVPEEVQKRLRSQIMAACKVSIEVAQSEVAASGAEFAGGRGIAKVRAMDTDIALSINVEAEEPVNPVKDAMMVLMSVSFSGVSFQHMLGIVFRGTFYTWEVIEGQGGSGFTTDYYDANGRRYMSFSTYGQGAKIEVY